MKNNYKGFTSTLLIIFSSLVIFFIVMLFTNILPNKNNEAVINQNASINTEKTPDSKTVINNSQPNSDPVPDINALELEIKNVLQGKVEFIKMYDSKIESYTNRFYFLNTDVYINLFKNKENARIGWTDDPILGTGTRDINKEVNDINKKNTGTQISTVYDSSNFIMGTGIEYNVTVKELGQRKFITYDTYSPMGNAYTKHYVTYDYANSNLIYIVLSYNADINTKIIKEDKYGIKEIQYNKGFADVIQKVEDIITKVNTL